jgi:Mitochondrial carrier protein
MYYETCIESTFGRSPSLQTYQSQRQIYFQGRSTLGRGQEVLFVSCFGALTALTGGVGNQVAGLKRAQQYGAHIPPQFGQSLRRALLHIWQVEGLRGLYKGALPSVLKAAPQAAVTLTSYPFFVAFLSAVLDSAEHSLPGKGPQMPVKKDGEPAASQDKPHHPRWWPVFQHKS